MQCEVRNNILMDGWRLGQETMSKLEKEKVAYNCYYPLDMLDELNYFLLLTVY